MAENPELNQEEICALMKISPSYLTRSLKKDFGHGFTQHRARVRVASFMAFMRREQWTITRAALASGFGSYTQFYRTFVKITGWKPKEYLDKNGRNQVAEIKV
jgi:methylphosphotriester-DNA--protein-cysteine methyltransferase